MMNLKENRSKIWFKVLTNVGEPIDGSLEKWSLPHRQYKGDELNFGKQPACCLNEDRWVEMPGATGTWLVSNPKELYPSDNTRRIFVAELLSTPSHEVSGIIWIDKVRLVREATNLDLKRFGIFRAFRQIIDEDDE